MNLGIEQYDICACGDYRQSHVDGTGRCLLPDNIAHGFEACHAFRLSAPAQDIPACFQAHPDYSLEVYPHEPAS